MEQTNGPTRIVHWSQLGQTFGGVRLIHASGHDTGEGFKALIAAGDCGGNILNRGVPYDVQSSELLKMQVYGTAAAGDVTSGMMLLERNIEGGGGNYIDFNELRRRRGKQVNLKVTLTAGGAGYGAEETIKSELDILWGGREYAWLGATCDVNCAGIVLRGPDLGNVKLGVPGNAVDAWPRGNDFFPELSRIYNDAFIPVIQANNAGNTYVSFVADENLTSLEVTLHLMLLD